ncbi:MAG TPA: aldehyde dehydrogenase family protein [Bacteroidales bacterium]|jgi:aldehyde dehydrogenase (NAD+)|nr:aldehyde dehydrogenase family protein [Bacteroidales bacterium]HOS71706.1 aldehyde dehydrogenase family protein [Bacteroidales bacterium]HQH25086.1 aldehyde dehydrogenase family protein [Bacteroidales bacterium]HQJ82714.1 aldehyde dehydrogenase family protein [Bacteroidales bacterium]
MGKEEINSILEEQLKFFRSGKTLDINFRLGILKKFRTLIIYHEKEIADALWKDFHKPEFEVIATETGFVLKELNLAIKKLKKWARPKKVRTPFVHFPARSYITHQPYGQVLVLSPWNYPFQLVFLPMLGAITAGNCVIVKASGKVPNITSVMQKIIGNFPAGLVAMVNGDHSISEHLLSYKFDYIFFTGSTRIGKYVMQKASENLIPVSLELGGKNPCVVTSDAKLGFAAKRIVWGKFINAGQTCICADYLLVDKKVKDRLLDLISAGLKEFYGENPEKSRDFARIINEENLLRLVALTKTGHIVAGGNSDTETLYLEPTVIKDITPGDLIMQEEIFGPVLPVIEFENLSEVYNIIERNPKPLAVYIFTRSKKLAREFLARTSSGTAAVNDTVMQIASPFLPYGGVGYSGMGRYHGRRSFETFSNTRSVLVKSNLIDLILRYPPYTKFSKKIIRWLMN